MSVEIPQLDLSKVLDEINSGTQFALHSEDPHLEDPQKRTPMQIFTDSSKFEKSDNPTDLLLSDSVSESDQVEKGWWQHFKGGVYYVIGVVVQRENGEKLVLYHHESDANPWSLWARPLEMFLGYKVIEGENVRRFTPLKSE